MSTTNKNLAYALRILNLLDVYDRNLNQVSFFSNDKERDSGGLPTIVLTINEDGGFVQVASSTCMPTNGWGEHVAAYRRAEEFLRLSCLRDTRWES
jgi:hypothetical protein